MMYLLAGDIGGTKTILQLVAATDEELSTEFEKKYVSNEFPDLVPMVQAFIAEAEECAGTSMQPQRACFAIAGPVVNNTSKLTNLTWDLKGDRLAKELHLDKATLINDFEAIGYGIPGLEEKDLHTLQVGKLNESAPIAVIGAGYWARARFSHAPGWENQSFSIGRRTR